MLVDFARTMRSLAFVTMAVSLILIQLPVRAAESEDFSTAQ